MSKKLLKRKLFDFYFPLKRKEKKMLKKTK